MDPREYNNFGEIPAELNVSLTTSPEIVAVFRLSDYGLVFLNSGGRRRIDEELAIDHIQFTIHDLIGVGSTQRFFSEALTKARVIGTWSGPCELRDAWGSPFLADVVLSARSPRSSQELFIVLNATTAIPTRGDVSNLTDREMLHALMTSIPDAIYFKDSSSRFLRISKSMSEKFGLGSPREAIGKTDFDFFSNDHAAPAFDVEQSIQSTGIPIVDKEEIEFWHDGRKNWVSTTKMPLRDSTGKIVGTFGISRDITLAKVHEEARQEMESQLQLHGKLESIGRLAAGIAHEINTPAQYISTNLEFLKSGVKELSEVVARILSGEGKACVSKDPQRKDEATIDRAEVEYLMKELPLSVAQSIEGLERISRIVRSLKEFSHPSAMHKSECDLNKVIENSIVVCRHEWKYVAEVVTELDPSNQLFPCIPDQIGQVVLNLLVNAAHAVGDSLKERGREKGTVTVKTVFNSDSAIVEVSDDGTGIPEDVSRRIFEPFFTTKPVGKGTGQGLAMVKSIVETNHKGRVEVTTKIGAGTTFRIWLPRSIETYQHDGIMIDSSEIAPP